MVVLGLVCHAVSSFGILATVSRRLLFTPPRENPAMKMTTKAVTPDALPSAARADAGVAPAGNRLAREWRTMEAMIRIYCRGQHRSVTRLCAECQGLLDYATVRLERCHFGADKPTCAKCPVHCYQPARREQVKVVMRHAGPRMIWRHPLLSLFHWLDGFRKAPPV
jgi:Nitrous oxide-stimulated promoter